MRAPLRAGAAVATLHHQEAALQIVHQLIRVQAEAVLLLQALHTAVVEVEAVLPVVAIPVEAAVVQVVVADVDNE